MKTLVLIGSTITSVLFVLWAGPDRESRIPVLRKIASKASSFPVGFSPQPKGNTSWKEMVEDLAVGSGLAERVSKIGRGEPRDVVSAIADGIHTIEYMKEAQGSRPIPHDYRKIIKLDLVKSNASKLANFLVEKFEESDRDFSGISTIDKFFFRTLGDSFKKGKKKLAAKIDRQCERAWANESVPKSFTSAKLTDHEATFRKDWAANKSKALADFKQTPAHVREDLRKAVTSRLKNRLKSAPVKSE